MFETFDHTADVGLRIITDTLPELFEESARALFSLIVNDLATIQPIDSIEIDIPAADLEDMFFAWLRQWIYRFDTDHMLFCDFRVCITEKGLHAFCRGEKLNQDRHLLVSEVKAVTYHDLLVEERDGKWIAEVILDI